MTKNKPFKPLFDIPEAQDWLPGYTKGLRNITNHQLIVGIEARIAEAIGDPERYEHSLWALRAECAELRRRLSAWADWLDGETQPMEAFDVARACPKCGAAGAKKKFCAGGWQDGDAVCFLRRDAECEHMHRECKECRYEWLEACPNNVAWASAKEKGR